MAFNADANAYTDFRSTVYTLSAPTRGKADKVEAGQGAALFAGAGAISTAGAVGEEQEVEESGTDVLGEDSDNLSIVLDLLHQMMFRAKILKKDVDSERGVILSELRDRNGISNRSQLPLTRVHTHTLAPTYSRIITNDILHM